MTLADWIKTQTERDTLRLVVLAIKRPRVGTTSSDIKTEPRDQWTSQKRHALRYVMAQAGLVFADLQQAVIVSKKIGLWVRGLPSVDAKTDMLATYIPVFWMAYEEFRARDISGEDDAKDTYDAGSFPMYGDSPAIANGWSGFIVASGEEQCRMIEDASAV